MSGRSQRRRRRLLRHSTKVIIHLSIKLLDRLLRPGGTPRLPSSTTPPASATSISSLPAPRRPRSSLRALPPLPPLPPLSLPPSLRRHVAVDTGRRRLTRRISAVVGRAGAALGLGGVDGLSNAVKERPGRGRGRGAGRNKCQRDRLTVGEGAVVFVDGGFGILFAGVGDVGDSL